MGKGRLSPATALTPGPALVANGAYRQGELRGGPNVVVLMIPGYQCLFDAAQYLSAACGKSIYMLCQPDKYIPRRGDIVLGTHALPTTEHWPKTTIAYQTENLLALPGYRQFGGATRWHYSYAVGMPAVPLGYVPQLHSALPEAQPFDMRPIDVLFVGSLHPRRQSIIDACAAKGLTTKHVFSAFGAELDTLITQSKVVLNLHRYEPGVFEYCRVIPLLHKCAVVVGETSLGLEGADLVETHEARHIPDVVEELVRTPRRLSDVRKRQQQALMSSPLLLTRVRKALGRMS